VFPPDSSSNSVKSLLPLWLEQWFVFFILYNNFIPISLYVTIELVNLGQAYLVASDQTLYEESVDMPCVVRSSNMAQELGLVSNIFSDKTGTLTRNEMRFVKFVVGGKIFDVEAHSTVGKDLLATPNYTKTDLYNFFLCLTTCHTVIREKNGTYRAESPDELALVQGVGIYNCGIQERGTSLMLVDMMGVKSQYEVLAVNAFNADRKRMSILLRDVKTDTYILMCKGADNVMMERLAMELSERQEADKALLDLACMGLRTLVISSKNLNKTEALRWTETWKAAAASLQDRGMP
jgi:phospholipid-transporting ATPase